MRSTHGSGNRKDVVELFPATFPGSGDCPLHELLVELFQTVVLRLEFRFLALGRHGGYGYGSDANFSRFSFSLSTLRFNFVLI